MNQKELAKNLNVSSTAVAGWAKEGMPCKSPGKQGRAADYDFAECLEWLQKNGKGYSVRRDRPGGTTAITNPPAPTSPAAPLSLESQDIAGRLLAERRRGAEMVLDFILESLPVLASGLIRFNGISPRDAVNTAFAQVQVIDHTAREALDLPWRDPEHPKIQTYLDGDLATLEEEAAAWVDWIMWALKEGEYT